ncbi:MAG: sigma-70 family RNA polymerase sigma factor [Verrucomicrobiota bacterium]
MMTNDRELLHRWASQADEAAFRLLVERYAGLVHGVARRRTGGQQALAQEIGQNVFTMLARKAAGLRDHPSLASWLHRAAVLESAHQLRRESAHTRRLARLAELTLSSDMSSVPDGSDFPAESAPELDEALARLRESDRTLLMRRFFEDLSYREIAESSGKNEAAVRKQLERALARLAPHLSRGGAAAAAVTALGAAESLRAAVGGSAPPGFAAGAGTAAIAGAPSITFWQIIIHSLKLMTYGKSLTLTGGALALFLAFGGSYSAARHFSVETADPGGGGASAGQNGETAAGGAGRPGAFGKAGGRAVTGNPGDSPARARLRARLNSISRVVRADPEGRSISIGASGGSGEDGLGFRALGEFDIAELDEAWKLLPDFRNRRTDYEGLALFLTSLKLSKEPPEKVLRELQGKDYRRDGKPPVIAVMAASAVWFKTDPAAAWEWRRQAVENGDFPQDRRRPIGTAEIGEWMGRDPEKALAALTPLGPEWDRFTRQTLKEALKDGEKRAKVWPVLEKADDRTALMVADSHPEVSDWTRETLLPWLLTRSWTDGTEPARVLNAWTWRDGELDEERFGMLCQAVGGLPTPAANGAALQAVRGFFAGVSPEARPKLLEKLIKDPARREKLASQL